MSRGKVEAMLAGITGDVSELTREALQAAGGRKLASRFICDPPPFPPMIVVAKRCTCLLLVVEWEIPT